MKVVKSEVTEFLSTNVPESETAWLLASVFNYGDEIRDGHYMYKYAGSDGTNTTVSPSVDNLNVIPTWILQRPTNSYAMLDGRTNTQTTQATSIIVELDANVYDSFALLNLEASSVNIELVQNSTLTVLYSKSYDILETSAVIDFYTYCFEPITTRTSIYDDGLPLYGDSTLTITMLGTTVKCGRLVFGSSYYVGETGYGANLSQESYSRKETDIFGNETLVQRGSVNLDSYEVQVPTSKIPALRNKARELDAIPILFVMDESPTSNTENLLNFGYWDSFNIMINDPIKSTISLTQKGIL